MSWFKDNVIPAKPGDYTLLLLKPDFYRQHPITEAINEYRDGNLSPARMKAVLLNDVDVRALYYQHIGREYYDRLAKFMTSGVSVAIALHGDHAWDTTRRIILPKLRALAPYGAPRHENMAHASDSIENAFRELQYFFGEDK